MEMIYCSKCGRAIPPGGMDEGKYFKSGEDIICPKCHRTAKPEEHTGNTIATGHEPIDTFRPPTTKLVPKVRPAPRQSEQDIPAAKRSADPTSSSSRRQDLPSGRGRMTALVVGSVVFVVFGTLAILSFRKKDRPPVEPREPVTIAPEPKPEPKPATKPEPKPTTKPEPTPTPTPKPEPKPTPKPEPAPAATLALKPGHSGAAEFVTSDTRTRADWRTTHGSEGHHVIGAKSGLPAWAKVTCKDGEQSAPLIAMDTPNALVNPDDVKGRILATMGRTGTVDVDIELTDNQAHQLTVYITAPSKEMTTALMLDAATGETLDTISVSGPVFMRTYLVWNVQGHVILRLTRPKDELASFSAIFLDGPAAKSSSKPAPAPKSTVAFVGRDGATQGDWKGLYGADGYYIPGFEPKWPAYVKMNFGGGKDSAWDSPIWNRTNLLRPGDSKERSFTFYRGPKEVLIDARFTDVKTHRMAVYLNHSSGAPVDIEVIDAATGTVLDTQTLPGKDSTASYLVWDIQGHAKIRITRKADSVAFAAIFFGAPAELPKPVVAPEPSAPGQKNSAVSAGTDGTTMGDWKGVYGADGYYIPGSPAAYPAYARVKFEGGKELSGKMALVHKGYLLLPGDAKERVSCQYVGQKPLSVDIEFTDGKAHRLALFLNYGVKTTVDVTVHDAATDAQLGAVTIPPDEVVSRYLLWDIQGHVILRITRDQLNDAAFSGLFFGPVPDAAAPQPGAEVKPSPDGKLPAIKPGQSGAAEFVVHDAKTLGNWPSAYGAEGYHIVGLKTGMPDWAKLTFLDGKDVVADGNSKAPAHLQKPDSPGNSIRSCRLNERTLNIDLDLTDGRAHKLAIHIADISCSPTTVEILDATSGTVLSTQKLTAKDNQPLYLVWNVQGHIVCRLTKEARNVAQLSGIFLGGPAAKAEPTK